MKHNENALGYIRYSEGKRVKLVGNAAIQFLEDDKNYVPGLPHKQGNFLNVYYLLSEKRWSSVPQNFSSFVEALPYLQFGVRVIVEYNERD